jgi:hypothetical protein
MRSGVAIIFAMACLLSIYETASAQTPDPFQSIIPNQPSPPKPPPRRQYAPPAPVESVRPQVTRTPKVEAVPEVVHGGPGYRYFAFPASGCDDGGIGVGRCTTVVAIGKLEPGTQDWYVRWSSAAATYRNVAFRDAWHSMSATCVAIADGMSCKTVLPNDVPYYYFRAARDREFQVTRGGTKVVLIYAPRSIFGGVGGSSSSGGSPFLPQVTEGVGIDISSITNMPLPQ